MTTRMTGRTAVAASLAILSAPLIIAAGWAATYRAHHRSDQTLISGGLTREYMLHVPTRRDSSAPVPLVISLHGGAIWPAAQRDISQWNRVADANGFIVAYPSAVAGRGPRAWRASGGPGQRRDMQFIADLIDTLARRYRIDRERVYVDGLSNGGGMAFAVSCELAGRVAAIGVVAPAIFLPWMSCRDQRPVPIIAFHGTADSAVPYTGGKSWVAPNAFPAFEAWIERWGQRNSCSGHADSSVAADVVRREYRGCAAPVVMYRIEDGGHTWPGGGDFPEWFTGRTTRSVDASEEMWRFYRAQRARGSS